MSHPEPDISINVDVTNPGQFFACCGLLELADQLWPGVEAWFDCACRRFCLSASTVGLQVDVQDLIRSLTECPVANTMTTTQVCRRKELSLLLKQLRKELKGTDGAMKKELQLRLDQLDEEKKGLDSQWREQPIVFGSPFNLQVDWFLDAYSGGSRFKTWAGQQSVIDITRAMYNGIGQVEWGDVAPDNWLGQPSSIDGVPFNFDSNLGTQASSIDVGYSLDALKLSTRTRPLIELGAFIGLQRFRPSPVNGGNLYLYRIWQTPLTVRIASIAACTFLSLPNSVDFEFRLLYRTKYLKSFLPATQIGDSA